MIRTVALLTFLIFKVTIMTSEAKMTVEKDKDGLQKMSFKPPKMSEEMEHSYHMPKELR